MLPALCCSRQYAQAWRATLKVPFRCTRDDRVPVLLAHVEDHAVAQDAGVVDDDVELAEVIDRAIDDALGGLEVGDALEVGDCFAARRADFLDHVFGRRARLPGAVEVSAEVIDDDLGAVLRQQQRFFASDTAAGAGDNRNFACPIVPFR